MADPSGGEGQTWGTVNAACVNVGVREASLVHRTRVVLVLFLALAGWSSAARASVIQPQPPATIFAAACSTCHGPKGEGGRSWVTGINAPRVGPLAISPDAARQVIRRGSYNHILPGYNGAMPGFGPAEITDGELDHLLTFMLNECQQGCPAPARPRGTEVKVDILDADPWYSDSGADNAIDPYDDRRRVVLAPSQFLTVTNTGKTWHTMTNTAAGKDSGFIGDSGNMGEGTGYYYADQASGLAPGCQRYLCKLHPYMQFEVCAGGERPTELTRASKAPLDVPPVAGSGEIWVNAQSQEESARDPGDGAMQVIDAATWRIEALIGNVGNNPHNAWYGKGSDGGSYVLTASWHDNQVTLIDAETKAVVRTVPVGAAAAHVQVSPGPTPRWFVTIMGGSAVQEVDLVALKAGQDPTTGLAPIRGEFSPHGLWFCDDGDHFLTADTLADTVSLYSANSRLHQSSVGTGGTSPLATSIFGGYGPGGCVRAYSNNAGTASLSVYDINPVAGTVTRNTRVVPPALRDAAGNLKLRDTSISPVRWASMPIQTPVSPDDATAHDRYMVTANKASFNVSITALNARGDPTAIYTFPAGLGAHGVTFGRKARCDDDTPVCYYAYVTNTFEDYIGVYDLERVASSGAPGSATEQVRLKGYGAKAVCQGAAECTVPITTFCPDCRAGAHVGDVPLRVTTKGKYTFLKEHLWIDPLHAAADLALDLTINTGAQGIVATTGTWRDSRPVPTLTSLWPAAGDTGVTLPDAATPASGLAITGTWPVSGRSGGSVVVFGSGFPEGRGDIGVTFNGVQAPVVQVLNSRMLSFTLPSGATSGRVEVTAAGGSARAAAWLNVPPDDGFGGTWVKPDESTIPAGADGDMIRYGRELLTKTNHYFNVLGVVPGYKTGSDLNCTSCHMGEGTAALSSPFAVAYGKYSGTGPYFPRSGKHLNTEGRIQGCLKRSMNAQSMTLPEDGREMQSMVAYFRWLATGMKVADWTMVKGQGFAPVPALTRALDPVRGRQVYAAQCASCHGTDGLGMTQVTGTVVPPLWGPRAFNDGAGIFRPRTGVGFIKGNMPLGTAVPTDPATQLSLDDAWDVTAFVVYQNRPAFFDRDNDWRPCANVGPDGVPDWMRKLPDAAYGPYLPRWDGVQYTCDPASPPAFDPFTHRYGPWQDALELQTTIINDFKACGRSPCP